MMKITVTNNTEFPILLNGTLFHPGHYGTMPNTPIDKQQSITFELEENIFGGGVNGGNSWMVILDNFERDTWAFATGCISPIGEIGERQAGVAESSDPEAGISAATPKGNSIISTRTFSDKNGPDFNFTAQVTFDASQTAVFVVGIVIPN